MDQSYWKEQLNKYRTRSLSRAEEELLWDALADAANAEGWKEIVEDKNIALAILIGAISLGMCIIIAAAVH